MTSSGVAIVPESLRYMHVPSVVFRSLADIELVSELAVAHRRDERSLAVNCFLADLSTELWTGERKRDKACLTQRRFTERHAVTEKTLLENPQAGLPEVFAETNPLIGNPINGSLNEARSLAPRVARPRLPLLLLVSGQRTS